MDLFKPPRAWLVLKPRNYNEYCRQIRNNLRLTDGRTAEAVDDRSVKCVCGKTIRINIRFNWRYFIQKPTFTDGKLRPKGHWYMCPEVNKIGSVVEDWIYMNQGKV